MKNTENKEKKMLPPNFTRGGVYIADLGKDKVTGEQMGVRPVVVIQNNLANKVKPTIVVAICTTNIPDTLHPVHVKLTLDSYKRLKSDCVVLLDQVRTISKDRIRIPLPLERLNQEDMKNLDHGLLFSLGLNR